MTDSTSTLVAMIGDLDGRSAEISRQIELARGEIAQANRKIGELTTSQKQMTSQVGALRQELAHLSATESARSAEVTKRISALEQGITSNTAALAEQTLVLQQLLGAQKEEAGRRKLEQEKAQFVVRLNALLAMLQDGVVRYLVATRAIDACAQRDVRPESFQGLTDQKTASDLLNAFAAIKRNASTTEQAEAQLYLDMHELSRDISEYRQSLVARAGFDNQHKTSLMARKGSEEEAVATLSVTEIADKLKSRHISRNVAAAGGAFLFVAAAALALAVAHSDDWGSLPEIAAFCLGIACFVVARLNSDAHRAGQLAKHKVAMQSSLDELAKLDLDVAARDQDAQRQLVLFEGRMTKVNITPSTVSVVSLDDKLQAFLGATQQAENLWRSRHSEVALIGAS